MTMTNYSDAGVTNGVAYYYAVTAVSSDERADSVQASAVPLPSLVSTNLTFHPTGINYNCPGRRITWDGICKFRPTI